MKLKTLLLSVLVLFTNIIAKSDNPFIQYKLDNGFTVILSPDPLQSEAFGMVVVNAGAKHDPPTATGLAHYMEHMLFKGTQQIGTVNWEKEKPWIEKIIELYDELALAQDDEERRTIQLKINEASLKANEYVINNELWSVLMEMGGTGLNAGTGPDATYYFNSFPPGQIEKWLEIYSHRFIDPVFRGFQAELEVVYEEKNMYNDMFFFTLLEAFNYNFFKNHPYGQQSIIGSIDHLKNPQLSKMIDFYNTWYVANNMALVLTGNFDPEVVMPMIKDRFSRLPSRDLPHREIPREEPFNGREFVSGRYSPISLGILGFRTPTQPHPDKIHLEIANGILSNTSGSGLLDQLMLENKIMMAQLVELPYIDHGATAIIFIPKLFRQSRNRAEKLVLEQLKALKTGQFDASLVEAIKLEKYRDFQLSLEDPAERGQLLAGAFVAGEELENVFTYSERIKDITREDIMRVANIWYGDDFLAFHSKMGSQKTEKIEKPGFEPVISNLEARSDYVLQLDNMPVISIDYQPVDFTNDIQSIVLKPYATLFHTENQVNDIFSLTIRYHAGTNGKPILKHVATVMNYAGADNMSPSELRSRFAKLGVTFSISASENYFDVEIIGPEQSLAEALSFTNSLLYNPVIPKSAMKKIWENERIERRMETSEPMSVARILFDYARYGENSPYLTRLSRRQVKRIVERDVRAALTEVLNYQTDIHFTGQTSPMQAKSLIDQHFQLGEELQQGITPMVNDFVQYHENTILFIDDRKAVQSNIIFFLNGESYSTNDQALIDAYNTYFGGDFSGIVMQEIREFRSLSYAAMGNYITPPLQGKETAFMGYVGTQSDKTIEALEVYTDILKNLPHKPERMQMIRNYLIQSGQTQKPGFRRMSKQIQNWKLQGWQEDPYLILKDRYKSLEFNDIVAFHEKFIKDKPLVIMIVGNKRDLDMDAIAKFGKITELDQSQILTR